MKPSPSRGGIPQHPRSAVRRRLGDAPRPSSLGATAPRRRVRVAHVGLLVLAALLAASAPSAGARAADGTKDGPVAAMKAAADGLRSFSPERRQAQHAWEEELRGAVDPSELRAWHDRLSSRPHVAGSQGDRAVVEALASSLEELGLEVEKQELWLYLPRPVAAEVTVLTASDGEAAVPEEIHLGLREDVLAADPYSGDPDLDPGWNAYSGSATVTAGVVYANRAKREDFARLAAAGVDVEGKIVVARYGGLFRGYKAKFAEEAGAAGLILFLDPEDTGYVRGLMWPDGGWANGSSIQRGALLTLPYPGDPLTPGVAAVQPPAADGSLPTGAGRLDPSAVAFPAIPVQPVGWRAAAEILSRMDGPAVPAEWQGGLPFNYRLGGGDGLRVRLRVEQERRLVRTWNVVGTLRGARHPEQMVLVGCHHDAWSFGAGDPNAGSILVAEAARVFAAAAKAGHRPDRSLVFAHWGAEEFGILGSVEWVEAHADELAAGGVAYLNLDMAAMGPRFGASATPTLAPLIRDATRAVASPVEGAGSVYDEWASRGDDDGEPRLGALGGGSDHVGFYAHLGIPSASLGGGGSEGVSYHTGYEDLAWYRAVVGEGYAPAAMLTRVVATALARLANADLLPLDPSGYGRGAGERLDELAVELEGAPVGGSAGAGERPETEGKAKAAAGNATARELEVLAGRAEAVATRLAAARAVILERLASGDVPAAELERANRALRAADRAWLADDGLPGRPWYRNQFAAPDADSGYAPWVLPGLTASLGHGGRGGGDEVAAPTVAELAAVLDRLSAVAADLEAVASAP
jgi:N-acetylated-alpha-linked acidic dipeptidase